MVSCCHSNSWIHKNCAFYSETRVDVKESVRGQDIFIIQTIPRWDRCLQQKKRKMIHLLKVVFGVLKCLSSSDTNIELEKTKGQTNEKSLD